jgi:methylenetetrahydrofolate reductase (NADPH)
MDDDARVAALVAAAQLEIVPVGGAVELACRHIPLGTTVTVTCLPAQGPERSVAAAVALVAAGYAAIPHLAARSVGGRTELARLVARCRDAGIEEYFVIGGDRHDPAGPYAWAGQLMEDLLELAGSQIRIGVAGYPERHPVHGREELAEALVHKQHLGATSLVTQLCFDAAAMASWLREIAAAGIRLPVTIGAPGAVRRSQLIDMSGRIGVTGALSFLRGNRRSIATLLAHRQFQPGALIAALLAAAPEAQVEGLHLYTFNEVERTVSWQTRQRRAAQPCGLTP